MGYTIAEKILMKKAGRVVKPGDIIVIEPDVVMSHDTMSGLAIDNMLKISKTPKYPSRIVINFDHIVPPATIEQGKVQRKVLDFIKEHNMPNFLQEGICHQVLSEKGYAFPGGVIIGSDSHSCSFGAFACFGTGMGATDIGVGYATGKTWLRVPESILIKIEGKFAPGVFAKDLMLKIVATLGVDGGTYKALEFVGSTVDEMEMHERFTLTNMAIEAGGKTGLIGSDSKTAAYLNGRYDGKVEMIKGGEGNYCRTITIDVSKLEPQVACPHDLDNLKDVSIVEGLDIHQVFIGTCTNGRFEDLEIAAKIMEGKKVSRYTRTIITPASVEVYQKANDYGYIKIFQDAGAIVCNPGCGPCLGRHQGVMAPGERSMTTMNRNYRGRMGSPDSEIYLGSPATCAASALTGKITDARGT